MHLDDHCDRQPTVFRACTFSCNPSPTLGPNSYRRVGEGESRYNQSVTIYGCKAVLLEPYCGLYKDCRRSAAGVIITLRNDMGSRTPRSSPEFRKIGTWILLLLKPILLSFTWELILRCSFNNPARSSELRVYEHCSHICNLEY